MVFLSKLLEKKKTSLFSVFPAKKKRAENMIREHFQLENIFLSNEVMSAGSKDLRP